MLRTPTLAALLLLAGCSRPEAVRTETRTEPAAPPAEIAAPAAPAGIAAPAESAARAAETAAPGEWRVTERGIGPLRAGMPRTEVERVLGAKLQIPAGEAECAMPPLPGAGPGTLLMVVNDTLVRVDVADGSTIATAEGARIGDTRARIDSLYPGRVRVEPHKYTDGKYLVVPATADTTRQFVFETDERGRVTRYRAGRLPEVAWVEGCS